MKKFALRLILLLLAVFALYGVGRFYYLVTGGFMVSNISSDFPHQPLALAMDQPYYYLGKGCQSYVFASADDQYVIKFFKYQRYRLQPWLTYFPPLPAIVAYRQEKIEKKWNKLDGFVQSWKIAFENLKDETALIFVHLNKTDHLKKTMTLYDKIGQKHLIALDEMEFCIQRRARMLCDILLEYKEKENLTDAKQRKNVQKKRIEAIIFHLFLVYGNA